MSQLPRAAPRQTARPHFSPSESRLSWSEKTVQEISYYLTNARVPHNIRQLGKGGLVVEAVEAEARAYYETFSEFDLFQKLNAFELPLPDPFDRATIIEDLARHHCSSTAVRELYATSGSKAQLERKIREKRLRGQGTTIWQMINILIEDDIRKMPGFAFDSRRDFTTPTESLHRTSLHESVPITGSGDQFDVIGRPGSLQSSSEQHQVWFRDTVDPTEQNEETLHRRFARDLDHTENKTSLTGAIGPYNHHTRRLSWTTLRDVRELMSGLPSREHRPTGTPESGARDSAPSPVPERSQTRKAQVVTMANSGRFQNWTPQTQSHLDKRCLISSGVEVNRISEATEDGWTESWSGASLMNRHHARPTDSNAASVSNANTMEDGASITISQLRDSPVLGRPASPLIETGMRSRVGRELTGLATPPASELRPQSVFKHQATAVLYDGNDPGTTQAREWESALTNRSTPASRSNLTTTDRLLRILKFSLLVFVVIVAALLMRPTKCATNSPIETSLHRFIQPLDAEDVLHEIDKVLVESKTQRDVYWWELV